jgi:hypothetical protein
MSLKSSTPDPTAALRQQREQIRRARVDHEAVVEALVQLVRDTMFEETNALTLALRESCEHPPQDRWALDRALTDVPSRTRAEVGLAFLRLCGEAWRYAAEAVEEARVAGRETMPMEQRRKTLNERLREAFSADDRGHVVDHALLVVRDWLEDEAREYRDADQIEIGEAIADLRAHLMP